LSRNLRHLRLDLDGSVSARGEEQKGLKMRIQKCSSTWRRAKTRQNAHPEMLDHILVQVERFVPLPANAKFQDTLAPKLGKNVKNAKFQDAASPKT
jgi:hypothetical protein